jgi:hypothetical protein
MIAPLYGHLSRDPKALSLMQDNALCLLRWTERMNSPSSDMGEFAVRDEEYLSNDAVPDTLIAVLKHLSIDFIPETKAAALSINEWLDAEKDLSSGTPLLRGCGFGTFDVCGQEITALAQPYRFYLIKRVQDEYDALSKSDRVSVRKLLGACDMVDILEIKLNREIRRENNLEVWA